MTPKKKKDPHVLGLSGLALLCTLGSLGAALHHFSLILLAGMILGVAMMVTAGFTLKHDADVANANRRRDQRNDSDGEDG